MRLDAHDIRSSKVSGNQRLDAKSATMSTRSTGNTGSKKKDGRTQRERSPLMGPWCPECGEPYDGIMCWHCQLGR